MIQGIASTAQATPKQANPELKKAAEKFEAVFLRQVLGEMRKAKLSDELFGSSATDNFRELADAQTADAMSKLGAFGIGQLLEKQLGRLK